MRERPPKLPGYATNNNRYYVLLKAAIWSVILALILDECQDMLAVHHFYSYTYYCIRDCI